MRKLLPILVLTFFLLVPTLQATETLNIEYPGPQDFFLFGNVSLSFVSSNRDNQNDMNIISRMVFSSSGGYLTYYRIAVSDITVFIDTSFLETGRDYRFVDSNNAGSEYIFHVDFSEASSPLVELQTQIISLEEEVEYLQNQVENLTISNTSLSENNTRLEENLTKEMNNSSYWYEKFASLSANYSELQDDYNNLDNQDDTIRNLEEDRSRLEEEKSNLQNELEELKSKYKSETGKYDNATYRISELELDLDKQKQTINDLSNPFAITYTRDGVNLFYINLSWLIIGMILLFGLQYYLEARKKWGNSILSNVSGNIPFLKKKEEPKTMIWDMKEEEIPSAEKNLLKPEDKETEPETPSRTKKSRPQNKKTKSSNKKGSWWDTPEGMKRREELKKRAKSWNREKDDKVEQ